MLADYFEQNPVYRLKISEHTDNVENESYNQKLSLNRAKEVADYLINIRN